MTTINTSKSFMDLKHMQRAVFDNFEYPKNPNLLFSDFNKTRNKGFASVGCRVSFLAYTLEFSSLLGYYSILHYKIITLYIKGDLLKCL